MESIPDMEISQYRGPEEAMVDMKIACECQGSAEWNKA